MQEYWPRPRPTMARSSDQGLTWELVTLARTWTHGLTWYQTSWTHVTSLVHDQLRMQTSWSHAQLELVGNLQYFTIENKLTTMFVTNTDKDQ